MTGEAPGMAPRIRPAPMNRLAAMAYNPKVGLPVASWMVPTRNGLTKPAKLPRELMMAIPAAAAAPPRNAVGRGQNSGSELRMPAVARVSAAMPMTGRVRDEAGQDQPEPAKASRGRCMPSALAGAVGVPSGQHHDHCRKTVGDHGQQPDIEHVLDPHGLDQLRQPEAHAVEAHDEAEVDRCAQPDLAVAKHAGDAMVSLVHAVFGNALFQEALLFGCSHLAALMESSR